MVVEGMLEMNTANENSRKIRQPQVTEQNLIKSDFITSIHSEILIQ